MTGTVWHPVQGPADARPGALADTGHTLWAEYACHYWGGSYIPVRAHVDGSVTVHWVTGPDAGTERRHRTALNPDGTPSVIRDDHPITDPCMYRAECRRRSGALTPSV